MKFIILSICFAISFAGLVQAQAKVPQSAQAICVSAHKAEVREGPGKQFPVKKSVTRFTPLNQVASKPGWKQVKDLDGSKFWISSQSVSSDLSCAVIKTRRASLRTEPYASAAKLAPAKKYAAFKKVDREGEWVQLEDQKHERFWVHESNIWYPVTRMKLSFN